MSQEFQFGSVVLGLLGSLCRSMTNPMSLNTNLILPPLLGEDYQLLETGVSSAVIEP